MGSQLGPSLPRVIVQKLLGVCVFSECAMCVSCMSVVCLSVLVCGDLYWLMTMDFFTFFSFLSWVMVTSSAKEKKEEKGFQIKF